MFEVKKMCPLCYQTYIRHDDWDLGLYLKFKSIPSPMSEVYYLIIDDYKCGLSIRQLCNKYHFNHKTILNMFKKQGVVTRKDGRYTNAYLKQTKEKLDEYYKTNN